MNDKDYKPAEKHKAELFPCSCDRYDLPLLGENHHYEDCAAQTCVEDDIILASHMVADDVLEELTEALRAIVENETLSSMNRMRAEKALKRYNRLEQ